MPKINKIYNSERPHMFSVFQLLMAIKVVNSSYIVTCPKIDILFKRKPLFASSDVLNSTNA